MRRARRIAGSQCAGCWAATSEQVAQQVYLNEAPCAKQNRACDAERPGLRARSGLGCGVAGASLTGRRITRLPSLSACNKAGLGATPRLSPRCVASRRTAIISAMRVKAPESNTPGLYGP
jgi:hypothetical protein